MQLILHKRAHQFLRSIPQTTVYSGAELLLLSLLAFQCARLFWALVTPFGPLGDWRAADAAAPQAAVSGDILSSFDPFFRLQAGAPSSVVTSLDLQLFGVREDRATGRGSAIVGTPDGQQRSYVVGEEIMPGVTLAAVSFDGITISRNGVSEQLYLDQSGSAPTAAELVAESSSTGGVAPAAARPAAAGDLAREVEFQPRLVDGRVTGVTVRPRGNGAALQAAGLAPGDTIVSVNGRSLGSAEDAGRLAAELSGRGAELVVERGGRTVTVRAGASQ